VGVLDCWRAKLVDSDAVRAGQVQARGQEAIREATDPDRVLLQERLKSHERMAVDLLYGDQRGGQRIVSRFGLTLGKEGT
jgi:hypothetical protein